MEIGPIWRAMWQNKLRYTIIAAQVAVTLAIAANCVTIILDARRKMGRPAIFDEDNIVQVMVLTIDPALGDKDRREVWHRDLMARLRGIPGVRAVSASLIYTWMPVGLHEPVKAVGAASGGVEAATITADENLPDALGVEIDEGRWFTHDEVEAAKSRFRDVVRRRGPDGKWREPLVSDVVVSRALGERIFGEGPLVGKMLEEPDGDKARIIGVLRGYSAPAQKVYDEQCAIFWAGSSYVNWGTYLFVRSEPGRATALVPRIEELLANMGELSDHAALVRLMSDKRQQYFGPQQMSATLMALLIFLLLVVASLGIAGLTSFSVTAQTQQIGTRRALGATTNDILRHFLTETGIVTVWGLALGSSLSVPLNMFILRFYDSAKLSSPVVVGCALLLGLVALGAALPPALRASRISPAIATRNV